MKQRPRIYYSPSQRTLMWERWRKGDTLHQIAKLFDRYHSSIQRILAESGGIRPTERHRARSALTLIEREEISRGVVAGKSIRAIAATLGRAPSTVSREIRRNEGPRGYRASQAEQAAWDRGRRPQVCKLVQNRALAQLVNALIKHAQKLPQELYQSLTWTAAKRRRTTGALRWRQTSRSISVIPEARGNAGQMRMRMGY
jgi:IS30 family transposase